MLKKYILAKRRKGLAAVLQHIAEDNNVHSVTPLTPLEKIKKEVTSYLGYPSLVPDTNPLEWWKAENGRFPNLAYLAKMYLCICGTSVLSERVFSSTGHIANNLRNRLTQQCKQTIKKLELAVILYCIYISIYMHGVTVILIAMHTYVKHMYFSDNRDNHNFVY